MSSWVVIATVAGTVAVAASAVAIATLAVVVRHRGTRPGVETVPWERPAAPQETVSPWRRSSVSASGVEVRVGSETISIRVSGEDAELWASQLRTVARALEQGADVHVGASEEDRPENGPGISPPSRPRGK